MGNFNYSDNIPTNGTFTKIDYPIKPTQSADGITTHIKYVQFGQADYFGYDHSGSNGITQQTINNWENALSVINSFLNNINVRLETLEGASSDDPIEPTQYTVRFMNGTTTHYTVTGVTGTSVDIPNDPTKTGYRFVGWNTNSGATSAGTVATSIGTTNVTYYAIWTPNTYTVTLIINDGRITSGNKTQTVNYNSKATWTVMPNDGYNLPTTVTYGTISGSTVTSKAITSNTTVTVNCVQQQPQTTYYIYYGLTLPNASNLANISKETFTEKPTTWQNNPYSLSITNTTDTDAYFYYSFPTEWNVVVYGEDKTTEIALYHVSTFTLNGVEYTVDRMGRKQASRATQNLYAKC